MRRFSLALTVALGVLALPLPAAATMQAPVTLDGPNSDIRELGGVAMANDGTGGIAYLRRDPVDGRVHVYAARFDGQRWSPAQRVDVDQPGLPQPFDSSWVRIGASRQGRLVVTWVHPRARDSETDARFDAVYAAVLPRSSARFLAPTVLDFDVRDARAGIHPSLAMNATGQALLAYRVVTATRDVDPGVPAGFVRAETRVARFNGSRWSVLGSRADRDAAAFERPPTAENSPKVAIDPQGNGVMAFQEPEGALRIDRLWVRRIFGTSRFGPPLLASPTEFRGSPLNGAVDQFTVAAGPFGSATVGWRQQASGSSPLGGPRVFVNALPPLDADGAGRFSGAALADGGAAPPALGPVSVAAGRRDAFALAFGAGTEMRLSAGSALDRTSVDTLQQGSVPADPLVVLGGDDRAVVAGRSGPGQIAVLERRGTRLAASAVLGAGGGTINAFALAGSGRGDAIVGLHQGPVSAGRIAMRVVDSPPENFVLHLPEDWVRSRSPSVRWEEAIDALGPVRYRVTVDGRTVGSSDGLSLRVPSRRVRDGVHRIVTTAVDSSGQATATRAQTLRVDRRPPRARVQRLRGKRSVRVSIVDGKRGRVAGPGRTAIRWGDGKRGHGRARLKHAYAAPGRYTIVARLRDRAGNSVTRHLRVAVR